MKDEEEHRLFKDGCVIVHIIYNFITVSQAEVFITLVQDEPQSGWEIAVYSLGVWREKKKGRVLQRIKQEFKGTRGAE